MIAGLGLILGWSSSVFAQTEFTLTDADEWEKTAEPEAGTPEAELASIRGMLADGNHGRVVERVTLWLERYPLHPSEPDAYLLRGDALNAMTDYYEALFDYEYIARRHHQTAAFVTALERELEIAKRFVTGTKRKLWGMRIVDATDVAEELLIRIQERLPRSRLAEQAGLVLADWYYRTANIEMSAEAYDVFIQKYPDSIHIPLARRRLIYSNLAAFKGAEWDPTGLYDARARLQALKIQDPIAAEEMGADAMLTRIDESDAKKMLTTAQWYERSGDLLSAEFTIRRLVQRYPTAAATLDGARMAVRLYPDLPPAVKRSAPDYPSIVAALSGEAMPPTSNDDAADDAESGETDG